MSVKEARESDEKMQLILWTEWPTSVFMGVGSL